MLGPVAVRVDGRAVDLGTPRQRAIIAALALAGGRTVPTDTLIARVWGEAPPAGALATLHGYVGALRRALEPHRPPRTPPALLVTDGEGYALRDHRDACDAVVLERAVAEARELLAVVPDPLRPRCAPAHRDRVETAARLLSDALAGWRGTPYAELGDDVAATAERIRLDDLRSAAEELGAVAGLALGRHAELVGTLAAAAAAHPLHERWWALRAVALTRCGRQADALEVLQSLRALLDDELGVEPSPPLRELQTAILRQDASVESSDDAPAPVVVSEPEPEPAHPPYRQSPPLPPWPLAGRDDELRRLLDCLDGERAGRARTVLVTGEAGVGKSRLVAELSLRAFSDGHTVASGQCSVNGPPPLWPWVTIVRSLAEQLPDVPDDLTDLLGAPDDFEGRAASAARLAGLAARHPLVLVLEDVQWADPATVELLLAVAEAAANRPLLLALTMRTGGATPAPHVLRLTSELARRQGLRLDLEGLDREAATELVAGVTGERPDEVDDLWQRTAGNPFYLSELARAGGRLSGSLTDVVLARVHELPAATLEALSAASVVEVDFDADLVAYMLDVPVPELVGRLRPAIDAGLVVEGARRATYAFSHGVVREAVHDSLPEAERSAWHRAVGRVIVDRTPMARPDQRAYAAHHWELAGYAWAAEGWRAMVVTAEAARAQAAYDEEAGHLGRALAWQAWDLGSGLRERFELLMMRADAGRWGGDWAAVSEAVDEAVSVAEQLGDVELATRAAISTSEGALWQVRGFGVVHAPIVDALERAVRRLPEEQAGLRCRAQLALAMELFYGGDVARIDALVADALATAEASDDARLRASAYLVAFSARSRPDTVDDRVRYARAAREAAASLDDTRHLLMAETMAVSVANEVGDAATVRREAPRLVELTRSRGLGALESVLHVVRVPWLVMEGRDEEADRALERLAELAREVRMPNIIDSVTSTTVVRSVLLGEYAELAGVAGAFVEATDVPAGPVATVIALRAGDRALAERLHARLGIDLDDHTFMALIQRCMALEVALGLELPELAAAAYPLVLPYAGRMCSAGTAAATGPVDAYLARGALALGRPDDAARHQADAVALARAWGLPRLESELVRLGEHYTR